MSVECYYMLLPTLAQRVEKQHPPVKKRMLSSVLTFRADYRCHFNPAKAAAMAPPDDVNAFLGR